MNPHRTELKDGEVKLNRRGFVTTALGAGVFSAASHSMAQNPPNQSGDGALAQTLAKKKVFIALPGVGFEGRASLWTYLYRSVVNGSVNVLRSKRRREAAEERLAHHQLIDGSAVGRPSNDPEAQVLEGEVLANVAQALLQVRPQHRRVLVLRIMHGLTNTEIAEREGLPLATVGTWLRRGREELRKGLRPMLREMGRYD